MNGGFSNVRFHILRLVHDHNRVGRLNVFNRLDAAFLRRVDDIRIFGEAVNVDNQNLNRVGRGKVAKLG